MSQDPIMDVVPVPMDGESAQGNSTDYNVSLGLLWTCCSDSCPTM